MKEDKEFDESPEIPEWLLSGVMSVSDIIDIIIDNSNYDRDTVREAMLKFQKVLYEKLKEGHTVKSSFGTFYPHFEKANPDTGIREFTVEFVPTKEMLTKIEERKLKKLNDISLN